MASLRRLPALLIVAVFTVWSVLSLQPPAPRPADAPVGAFSAHRAFAHVQRMGAEVHVTGSAAADRVRDYLVQTLTGYGLRPEVQDATGVNAGKFGEGSMAHVRNVVAVLHGTRPTGRVILMAHYDSVQVSYGANDDGAGTSAMLEVARALTSAAPPRNDVIFVFTDAEEACLCGAEAFVDLHPLAKDPAVVLNLEARGSSGPALMFQTSERNSGVVGVWARVAPHPVGTSFAVEVYRLLQNDTDFTPVLAAGRFTGLNAAYIDGSSRYHSPQDTPSNLDLASLQDHGGNALALAREFGRVDLGPLMRESSGDATYFPLPGGLLLRYPGWLVWPIAVLALAAVVAFGWLARRRGRTTLPRMAAGLGLALLPLIAVAVVAQGFWALLVAIRPGYGELIDPHRPLWFRLAVLALTLTVVFLWYGQARRRIGTLALSIGGLGLLALLGIVLAALTPGGSYLTALPALAGAAAGLGALLVERGTLKLAMFTAAGVVATLVLTPAVTLFFPALGLAIGAAPALFAVLLALTWLPMFVRSRFWPAGVALVLAVALTAVGLGVDRWGPNDPVPTQLMYALDEDTGTARWVSLEASPGRWTGRYVHEHADLSAAFPLLPAGRVSVGPAQAAGLAQPVATVLADTTAGGRRTLRLRVAAARPVRLIAFYGPAGQDRVAEATVQGRAAPTRIAALNRFGVIFNGPPDGAVEVTLVLKDTAPFALRVVDGSDGLTGLPGFTPRPADVSAVGSHSSDLVAVAKTYTF